MITENNPYQDQLPTGFFVANRTKLAGTLPDSCAVLLFAGRAPHKTADEQYPFFANRNFFYLTGIEQEVGVFCSAVGLIHSSTLAWMPAPRLTLAWLIVAAICYALHLYGKKNPQALAPVEE